MKSSGIGSWVLLFCAPYLVLATLFGIATMELSAGFYTFLRPFVFCVLLLMMLLTFMLFFDKRFPIPVIIASALIAVLFNPFIPFYFNRVVWEVIDMVCAVVMVTIAVYNFTIYLLGKL